MGFQNQELTGQGVTLHKNGSDPSRGSGITLTKLILGHHCPPSCQDIITSRHFCTLACGVLTPAAKVCAHSYNIHCTSVPVYDMTGDMTGFSTTLIYG